MKITIESYGCASSKNDALIIQGLLEQDGHEIVENGDIFILNTCTVKSVTQNRMMHKIDKILKNGKKLIVSGCMPDANKQELEKIGYNFSTISTRRIDEITSVVDKIMNDEYVNFTGTRNKVKTMLPKNNENDVIRIIEICSGCDFNCSFCITKKAKGNTFSYPVDDIIKEMKNSLENGVKEFWFTGQDISCYGSDIGSSLIILLREVTDKIAGDYKIRLGMMNPSRVKLFIDDLIELYDDKRLFRFLHLPVQAGSDKVLKNMRRGHTSQDFVDIVNKAKNITIWTDVIAGFPGETDKEFEKTVKLLKLTKPDFTNISSYGARPGTDAAKMGQVSSEVRKERTKILSELTDMMSLENNKKWIGRECCVLVDEFNGKNWIGRNNAYKPVILPGDFKLGDRLTVKIKDALKTGLVA